MCNLKRVQGKISVLYLIIIFLLALLIFGGALILYFVKGGRRITTQDIVSAEKIIGLDFTQKERRMMRGNLTRNRRSYEQLRTVSLKNQVPPALFFNPVMPGQSVWREPKSFVLTPETDIQMPEIFEDLAFYPVTALAELIRTQKITSLQLTELYLERLKTVGPRLECVITLTENLAKSQAKRADQEITSGRYRGPLHGIPWGAKDLLSTKGIKTTWGARPYKDQVIYEDATVVERLEAAGAVLVAKLTMGALAWGDVWFGGKTKNPWNLEQGSSGSSAGSASATAAGLVGFSIGTETWGSIVSPSARCGVSGLRPTFGRVSRHGAMALSWSMDKIGPICRSAEDCALVFEAIYGPDGKDLTVVNLPFNYDQDLDIKELRVGYLKKTFDEDYRGKQNDEAALHILRSLGIELVPFELPQLPVDALSFILNAEAAAAFDELTRSGKDDLLKRQAARAWPNVFRQARFIPAVEYIQANRVRTLLIQDMSERMKDLDLYVAPSFGGNNLLLTNLTGHPTVVIPNGFDKKGAPTSFSLIGNLFEEEKILRLAKAFQEATDFHRQHPKLD